MAQLLVPPALLWVVLSGGRVDSLVIGLPAVIASAWLFARLQRAPRTLRTSEEGGTHTGERQAYVLRFSALPAFAGHFLLRSVIAGVDVARRTLSQRLDIAPDIIEMQTTVPSGAPRLLLVATMSLLPGSLFVEMHGDRISIHVLDRHTDIRRKLAMTEHRISRLFVTLPARS